MAAVSTQDKRALVATHLRRLDTVALAAFVADLWAARGFDTDVDGDIVTATRDGETRHIGIGDTTTTPDGESVAVVVDVSGRTYEGIPSLDAGDVTERLWYAVERPVARRLCETHFGATPSELSPPVGFRLRRAFERHRATAVVVAALAVVTVAVAAGLGALPAVSDGRTPAAAGASGPSDPPPGLANNTTKPSDRRQLLPGVTNGGIADIEALSSAHATALDGRSYSLWIHRSREEPGNDAAVRVERDIHMTVEDEQYRLDTDAIVSGDRTEARVRYHDGRATYVAPDDDAATDYRRVSRPEADLVPPPPSRLTGSLVETRLSTPTTTFEGTVVREGETLYRLTGTGQPEWPALDRVAGYDVTAYVTPDGLVRELHLRYTVQWGTRLVDVRRNVQYDRVGETTVRPPEWYGAERTETSG